MVNKNIVSMQKQKLNLQVELDNLMHQPNKDIDKINELKSDILYLEKQIEKIIGKKEIERQKELRNKKFRTDDINKNNYYNLKSMVKKISPMNLATNRIIGVIEKSRMEKSIEEKVRVKI